MTRHLVSVDTLIATAEENVEVILRDEITRKFATDVIEGRVIHDVSTDTFVLREIATDEFKAQAIESYVRFMKELDQ